MQHERYKDELRQKMGKPDVTDSNLKNIIDDLYRPNAKVGSGSTADAVRYELATGEKVGGRGHVLKAQDYTRALQDWLDKNPTASPGSSSSRKRSSGFTECFGRQVMNQYIANYIEKMASFSTVLSETVSLANEYWHPETPPVVMLFSQIGKRL